MNSGSWLRIIGGNYRGKRRQSPEGLISRPTLGRIREALFNILAPRIMDSVFADLYAGTGAIGLEALSRGSHEVFFVENNLNMIKVLEKNTLRLDPKQEKTRVVLQDARLTALQWQKQGKRFDILFLDPPYQIEEVQYWEKTRLDMLLAPKGLLILQHARAFKSTERWAGCILKNTRDYGKTTLAFYAAE
jgi:16S rRNA (guanine966-N2)-methyltransferase